MAFSAAERFLSTRRGSSGAALIESHAERGRAFEDRRHRPRQQLLPHGPRGDRCGPRAFRVIGTDKEMVRLGARTPHGASCPPAAMARGLDALRECSAWPQARRQRRSWPWPPPPSARPPTARTSSSASGASSGSGRVRSRGGGRGRALIYLAVPAQRASRRPPRSSSTSAGGSVEPACRGGGKAMECGRLREAGVLRTTEELREERPLSARKTSAPGQHTSRRRWPSSLRACVLRLRPRGGHLGHDPGRGGARHGSAGEAVPAPLHHVKVTAEPDPCPPASGWCPRHPETSSRPRGWTRAGPTSSWRGGA